MIIGTVSGFIDYNFAAVAIFGFLLGLLFHLWMKWMHSSSTPTSSTTPVATQHAQQPTTAPANPNIRSNAQANPNAELDTNTKTKNSVDNTIDMNAHDVNPNILMAESVLRSKSMRATFS